MPDILVAGPAFGSGRYGLACAEVCKTAQALGIKAVSGMHPDNPGALSGWPDVVMVPTGETSADMPQALAAMVRLAGKLGRGEALGPAEVDGYLPRGVRVCMTANAPATSAPSICCWPSSRISRSLPRYPSTRRKKSSPLCPSRICRGPPSPWSPPAAWCARATRTSRSPPTPAVITATRSPSCKASPTPIGSVPRRLFQPHRQFQSQLHPAPQLPARPGSRRQIGGVFSSIYALPGVATPVAMSCDLGRSIAQDLVNSGVDGCLLVAT